jgi:hypothetical protein
VLTGPSTTVEYAVKGVYEHTVGRLAEATKSGKQVPEERFAAKYAQDYVDFIRVNPWYLFDFRSRLAALWSEKPPLSGPDLIRRWERRFILTTELLFKEGYAHVIKLGTQSVYDAPQPVTAVVLSHLPLADAAHPDFVILHGTRADGKVVATIPRYEGFTTYSEWLASQGVQFEEVAGNRGDILISELVPDGTSPPRGGVLFEQPIITRPGTKRIAFAVPICELSAVLRDAAARDKVVVEHIYDF